MSGKLNKVICYSPYCLLFVEVGDKMVHLWLEYFNTRVEKPGFFFPFETVLDEHEHDKWCHASNPEHDMAILSCVSPLITWSPTINLYEILYNNKSNPKNYFHSMFKIGACTECLKWIFKATSSLFYSYRLINSLQLALKLVILNLAYSFLLLAALFIWEKIKERMSYKAQ